MNVPYFKCEDCGHEFEKTEFLPDVEEDIVSCPDCGRLDIQLVEKPATEQAKRVALLSGRSPVDRPERGSLALGRSIAASMRRSHGRLPDGLVPAPSAGA